MTDRYLQYLSREHAPLEYEIRLESQRPQPDEVLIARLKKLKLALKHQMRTWISSNASANRLIA